MTTEFSENWECKTTQGGGHEEYKALKPNVPEEEGFISPILDLEELPPTENSPLLNYNPQKPRRIWSGKRAFILSILSFSLFITYLPESLLQPFFPLYAESELGFSHPQVATILSLPPLFGAIFTPVAAAACFHYGRLPVWISGSFLMVLSMIIFAFMKEFYYMCSVRILQGLCVSLVNVSTQSVVTTVFARQKAEAMAVYQTAMTLSFTIGPTLGGVLFDLFGFRWMFLLNAFLGCVPLFGSTWLYLYHSDILTVQRTYVQTQTRFLDVLTYETILGALAWFLLYANFTFETLLQEHLFLILNCNPTDVGFIIFLQAITTVAIVKKFGEYADRHDSRWMIPTAFLIAASYHLIAIIPGGYWVMVTTSCGTLIIQGLVVGMLLPSTYSYLVYEVMKPGVDGTEEQVAQIMVFLEGFGFTLSTIFAGFLMDILPSYRAPNCIEGSHCETPFGFVMVIYAAIFVSAAAFLSRGLFRSGYRCSLASESLSEL